MNGVVDATQNNILYPHHVTVSKPIQKSQQIYLFYLQIFQFHQTSI